MAVWIMAVWIMAVWIMAVWIMPVWIMPPPGSADPFEQSPGCLRGDKRVWASARKRLGSEVVSSHVVCLELIHLLGHQISDRFSMWERHIGRLTGWHDHNLARR